MNSEMERKVTGIIVVKNGDQVGHKFTCLGSAIVYAVENGFARCEGIGVVFENGVQLLNTFD